MDVESSQFGDQGQHEILTLLSYLVTLGESLNFTGIITLGVKLDGF